MGSISKSLALVLVGFFAMSFVVGIACPVFGASVNDNSWLSKKPMLTGRADFGLSEVNGKMYAIGGYPGLNMTEEYDPQTDSWTTKTAMPTARFNFAIAVFENKIYCIGGLVGSRNFYQSSSVSGAIEVYDPATDTWEIKKPMPTPMAQLEANVVNDKIYLIGGRTGGQYTTVSTNQVYDPDSESWTEKAPVPYPVTNYASAVVDGKIYLIGGQDEFNDPMNLNVTQIYDPKQNTWSLGHPLAFALLDSAACTIAFSNIVYLIGGQIGNNGSSTNAVQVYDVDNDSWVFGPSMSTALFRLSVGVLENRIYAVGGTGQYMLPSDQASALNEMYLVSNETANPTSTPNVPEPTTLAGVAVAITASIILITVVGSLILYRRHRTTKRQVY